MPSGKYRIGTHLVIRESVTLEGTWRAPASFGNIAEMKPEAHLSGSVLLAVEGAGKAGSTPFITLQSNATLKGVVIFYPDQTKTNPPVAYPWTVATGPGGTENPSIVDVFMANTYQAVDFGSFETMRPNIRNLYADALYRGVYIDRCMDIARLENVHLAPFWHWTLESPLTKFVYAHGEGFIFGRTDWQLVQGCFAAIYKVGFRFTRNSPAGTSRTEASLDQKFSSLPTGNVLITGGGADLCDIAVLVEDSQPHAGVSFVNSQFFGDIIVKPTNDGPVRFTACGFFDSLDGNNGVALAKIDAGRSRVAFGNSHFYALRNFSNKPLLHVASGRLSVENCVFMNSGRARDDALADGQTEWNPEHIRLDRAVIAATITGNEFYGPLRITNDSEGKVAIADNVDDTDGTSSERK